MKRCRLLAYVVILCFLCSCSVTEQNEQTTTHNHIESATDVEVSVAAEDAQEKHDELFQLAMDELSAWYAYVDDNSTEDILKAAQDAMVEFFVMEGFSADDFSGTLEDVHVKLNEAREELSEEYIDINSRYIDDLKDKALDDLNGTPDTIIID